LIAFRDTPLKFMSKNRSRLSQTCTSFPSSFLANPHPCLFILFLS